MDKFIVLNEQILLLSLYKLCAYINELKYITIFTENYISMYWYIYQYPKYIVLH